MRKLRNILSIVILVAAVFPSSVSASGGNFWFFDGDSQTGQYRGFTMSSGWSGNLSGVYFTFNCPGGQCSHMDNRIESIQFDCTTMDNTDRLTFYTGYDFHGTNLGTVYFKSASCVNGQYKYELPTSWDNVVSSVRFTE